MALDNSIVLGTADILEEMPTSLEARIARHDREIVAIRKLILIEMRLIAPRDQQLTRMERTLDRHLNEPEAEHKAIRQDIRALAASQRETDRVLRGLMRSMEERGRNGKSRP